MGCCGGRARYGVYFRYLGTSTLTVSTKSRTYTWTSVNRLAPVDPSDVPLVALIHSLQQEGVAHMEELY